MLNLVKDFFYHIFGGSSAPIIENENRLQCGDWRNICQILSRKDKSMDESCLEYFLKVYRCSLLARHTASLGQYDIVTVPVRCPGKSTDSGRLKDI